MSSSLNDLWHTFLTNMGFTGGQNEALSQWLQTANSASTGISRTLAQCGTPIGIAPSGTMGNNGAVTMGTALNFAYTGAYVYYPANAISAGSAAGFYWTVMSTTTAGTVYNNTFDPSLKQIPRRVSSPTPFVTTGPGAFVGVGAGVNTIYVTVPANSMGPNGAITSEAIVGVNNSATGKVFAEYFGASFYTGITMTTVNSRSLRKVLRNAGVTTEQITSRTNTSNPDTGATGTNTNLSINTEVDQDYRIVLNPGGATDHIFLDTFDLRLTYGA